MPSLSHHGEEIIMKQTSTMMRSSLLQRAIPLLIALSFLSSRRSTTSEAWNHHHASTTSRRQPATRCQQNTFFRIHEKRSVQLRRDPVEPGKTWLKNSVEDSGDDTVDLEWLKAELTQYMEKRKEVDTDNNVGKVVGGTRGNAILEFVSGAPNKAYVEENPSNPLDYDELNKFGYGHLVEPMMKAGGRPAMYGLLGMPAPAVNIEPTVKSAPKLVIDRTGENDQARYSGLKLGQVLDDDVQAEALQQAQLKAERGERLRPKLMEEDYVQPFADKRNTSPKQTPDWTPEMLDEWGRQQGKAVSWARKSADGQFAKDPMELFELDGMQRTYTILTGFLIAISSGKATPTFLNQFIFHASSNGSGGSSNESAQQALDLLSNLQGPAFALLFASVGSAIFCGLAASEKNRSQALWAVKGLLGGPVSVYLLQSLPQLITVGEQRQQAYEAQYETGGKKSEN